MIILNIHGFMGEPDNKNYKYLKHCFPCAKIISPKLDYINNYPIANLNILKKQLEVLEQEDNDILIIGQSLGAFFALCLCAAYNIKTIVTNPCLMPFEVLPKLSDRLNKRHIQEYAELFSKIFAADCKLITTIIGTDDEIVDHSFTRRVLGETRYFEIDGGHSSLDKEKILSLFAEYVLN